MPDEPLLTLKQVADKLDLPESTVRYYRDAFLDHIPSIGTGRRRRYPPPAVAVLRTIADGYASGRSHHAILGTLEGATPRASSGPAEEPRPADHPGNGVSNLELLAAIVDGEREQRDALWQMAKEIVRLTEVLEGQEKVLTEIADHAGVRPALAAAEPRRALADGHPSGAWAPAQAAPVTPAPASAPQSAQVPTTPVPLAEPSAPAAPPAQAPAAESVQAPAPTAMPAQAPAARTPPPAAAMRIEPPPPPAAALRMEPPSAPLASPAPAPAPRASEPALPASEMERLRVELESERALVERLREAKLKLEHRVSDAESELEERRNRKRTSVLGRLLKPGDE